MPKAKTHKGTAKRVRKTGSGKLRHRHANRSHNRSSKSVKQGHIRGRAEIVSESNPRIAELIPHK